MDKPLNVDVIALRITIRQTRTGQIKRFAKLRSHTWGTYKTLPISSNGPGTYTDEGIRAAVAWLKKQEPTVRIVAVTKTVIGADAFIVIDIPSTMYGTRNRAVPERR